MSLEGGEVRKVPSPHEITPAFPWTPAFLGWTKGMGILCLLSISSAIGSAMAL